MYHICGIFWYHDARFCTTYVVSFWYHKRARNPLLMFRSQKTWYHRMEGNGRRLSRASRCMWINPLVVWTPAFIGEVTFNPQNSLITFLWESSQTKKGTGFDARSFFERLYQCQKLYNSLMDNKKYDSLLFKSKASPILQNLLITFLGRTSFSVCPSTSCRSWLTIWGLLRATAEVALFAFQGVYLYHSIGTFRDILTSIQKHISRYLYHSIRKEGIIRKA